MALPLKKPLAPCAVPLPIILSIMAWCLTFAPNPLLMSIYQQNIACLAVDAQTHLPSPLKKTLLTTKVAKTGLPVPLLMNENLPSQALHSLYDPMKEALKAVDGAMVDQAEPVTLVIAGFGGGYLAKQALAHALTCKVIVIEPRPDVFTSWLALHDAQHLLKEARLTVVISPSPAQAIQKLTKLYQPLTDGNLKLLELRQITALAEPFWQAFKHCLHQWIESLAGELASWAYFGTRWFKNIVTNIATITPQQHPLLPTKKHVCVVGAGPGAEDMMPLLRQRKQEGACVIACDAVVMGLQQSGIVPDIIISIDAQVYVNLHFVGINTSNSLMMADLSLNPQLAVRLNAHFFAGNHPLSRLSGLAPLNTGGGNVGGAAYALAVALQATSIEVIGLDFKFINGKPYASQVYIYPHFAEKSGRFNSSEQQSTQLMFRHNQLHAQTLADGTLTSQPALFAHYEAQFKQFCAKPQQPQWQNTSLDGRLFLKTYLEALKKNRLDRKPLFMYNLTTEEQRLWLTLWPSVATFYKQGLRGDALWQHNFSFALDQLEALAL